MPSSVVTQLSRTHKKPYRKSRQGCGNCKLRKVKCDESKPKCKRCISYGVICNYDNRFSDLQLSADGSFTIDILAGSFSHPFSQSVPVKATPVLRFQSIEGRECVAPYQLTDQDAESVKKFQTRTVFTISNDRNRGVYQNEMISLACSHPYLMHAIITLTLMHDRYLSALTTPLSTTEAYHWYQSVALFNNKLSGPVQACDQDPLWATAMCLGIISFFYIEARKPEEAWPLKPSSTADLNWLKMTNGKNEVWKVTGPMRKDSLFNVPYPKNIEFLVPESSESGLETLPIDFITLCCLDHSSGDDNPYRIVAALLGPALHLESITSIIFSFLSFIGKMPAEYKRLLQQKEPRSLLLLAYWYAKVCQKPHWWISPRAALEGQAICIFLRRNYPQELRIQRLLSFPFKVFNDYQLS